MNAAVLAVGTELVNGLRQDGNGDWIIRRLADLGVETRWRARVEDDAERIAALVRVGLSDADAVLVTGGLGPTEDDRTRDALALALGVPLTRDPEQVAVIAERFAARGRVAGPGQAKQADRPSGAAWIDNPVGSAPGILVERDGRLLAALPGVPEEMRAMFEATLVPRLSGRGGGAIARASLRIAGRPESYVDDLVRDLYLSQGTETTILAGSGIVELLLTARGDDAAAARARVASLEAAMRERLGRDVFGTAADTLPSVVGELCRARGVTVACGESCTGGLLGGALSEVAGSSAWFRGGLVCYADDVKASVAGVPEALIAAHGAVSEPVARALAAGARRACRADFGLGITGIAGPSGGTPEKPVGTVHIALDDGGPGRAVRSDWPGDRDVIRRRAVAIALDLLRRRLLD